MAEAMALGKPVIATGYSGNLDFMDEETAHLVPADLVAVPPGNDPYPAGSRWADPDLDEAARIMRQVADTPTRPGPWASGRVRRSSPITTSTGSPSSSATDSTKSRNSGPPRRRPGSRGPDALGGIPVRRRVGAVRRRRGAGRPPAGAGRGRGVRRPGRDAPTRGLSGPGQRVDLARRPREPGRDRQLDVTGCDPPRSTPTPGARSPTRSMARCSTRWPSAASGRRPDRDQPAGRTPGPGGARRTTRRRRSGARAVPTRR